MPKTYTEKHKVPSHTNPMIKYTVSKTDKGEWECSCMAWIRRRKNCKHINDVLANPNAYPYKEEENIIDKMFPRNTRSVLTLKEIKELKRKHDRN